FAGEYNRLQSVGQLVDVQDRHAVQLRYLVQIEVVGHDLTVVDLGKLDQLHVHFMDIGKIILENLNVKLGHLLDALQNVQAATSAVALERIGRVRYQLKFTQH